MANPMPSALLNKIVFNPTSSPCKFTNGPPEFPWIIDASD